MPSGGKRETKPSANLGLDTEFANENARIAWEISQAVDRIGGSLPHESQFLNLEPITFDPEHQFRGLHAVFTAGTVIGTGKEGILLIPERTRKILDHLKIPYAIASLE